MLQAHATTVHGIRQARRPAESSQFPGSVLTSFRNPPVTFNVPTVRI